VLALTRKTDYALIAMAGLSVRGSGPASTRDLAERYHLPLAALRNILKDLARGGLLVSSQGPQGGYRLARPPGRITIADVVRAIEGPVQFAPCCPPVGGPGETTPCRLEHSCRIKGSVRGLHERLVDFLNGVTIADLADHGGPPDRPEAEQTIEIHTTPGAASRAGSLTIPPAARARADRSSS
jgi:Rrf2 family protein